MRIELGRDLRVLYWEGVREPCGGPMSCEFIVTDAAGNQFFPRSIYEAYGRFLATDKCPEDERLSIDTDPTDNSCWPVSEDGRFLAFRPGFVRLLQFPASDDLPLNVLECLGIPFQNIRTLRPPDRMFRIALLERAPADLAFARLAVFFYLAAIECLAVATEKHGEKWGKALNLLARHISSGPTFGHGYMLFARSVVTEQRRCLEDFAFGNPEGLYPTDLARFERAELFRIADGILERERNSRPHTSTLLEIADAVSGAVQPETLTLLKRADPRRSLRDLLGLAC